MKDKFDIITTVRITKKELIRLLELAKTRKIKITPSQKDDVINYYIEDELFAEQMPGYCNLIIKLGNH